MAMTMSSSMPPTATNGGRRRTTTSGSTSLGNRRRRPPTATTPAHIEEEEEEVEEKREETDVEGNLRRSIGPSVRFAHFDTELEDSDQTITGVAQRRPSRSLLAINANRRWFETTPVPFRPRSTFFPDSTDDETMSAYKAATKSMSKKLESTTTANTNTGASRAGGASSMDGLPTFPVIHIGEIQFPVTRTVLWDRRVLAGPFTVTTTDVLPRLRLCNSLLKQLHAQLTHDTTPKTTTTRKQPQPRLVGYATGECTASGLLTLTQLVHHKPDNLRSAAASSSCVIPIHRTKLVYPEDITQNHQEMIHAARATFETTSGTSSRRHGAFDIQASADVSISRERSRAEIDVELDAVVPDVRLVFRLIRSLPLLMTPLAVSLLRCEFGNETQRFGFLTLDRARKAVSLLETDPLVLQRPIVGIWVYGVAVEDDAATADTIRVADPFLFQSCVRFLASKVIKERAQVDAGTFLVAVYQGSTAGPLPRFFECQVEGASAGGVSPQVPWRTAHARGQCLAGVTSFKGDLEIAMVLSSDETVAPVTVPAAPASLAPAHPMRDRPAHDAWRSPPAPHEFASSRIPAHDSLREARESATNAHPQSSAIRTETNSPRSMQSCCRSQQLLAAQHQEMLERQQCQLQDMQDQIAQLQLMLTETRAENARLLAASSSRFSGSSVGDSDRDRDTHEEEEVNTIDGTTVDDANPVPSYSRVTAEDDRGAVQSDAVNEAAAFNKRGQDESCASSLALSSISQRSDQSDLSSVSSSVVGARLKTLFLTEDENHDENGAEHQHVEETAKPADSSQDPQAASDATEGLVAEERVTERVHSQPVEQTTSCPSQYIPSARHNKHTMRAQCERDEFEDESDASRIDDLLAERLHIPNTPNREEIVRSGALATFGFSHGSSFSIPKIKYVPETVTCDSDEDDEEEVRRIELKYRKRLANASR